MSTVIAFGEVMLRLSTPGFLRFAQAPHLEISYGGGEANVAVTLANFGVPVEYVTRLPDNDIAQRCLNELRGFGVGTRHVARGGERMGIYFLETGAGQRGSKVTYDRAHSAMAMAARGDFDWEKIFAGAKWFHWSGITPALSDSVAEITREACAAAKARGLIVSFDLNYRNKLWSCEKAGRVLGGLMESVDLCIANDEAAASVFGVERSGKDEREMAQSVASQLVDRFNFQRVAITMRDVSSASRNAWSAMFFEDGKTYFSRRYDLAIVDRVGAGDSFSGALIFALLRGDDPQRAIEFAAAAGALKHSIPGDFNRVTLAEVEALVRGESSGRVQR